MKRSQIISSKNGVLYLKLREEFKPSDMAMHHTMACIDRDGVEVVQSHKEKNRKHFVKPYDMVLTMEESLLLAEGIQKVHAFWHTDPLPKDHILLSCGCIVDWPAHSQSLEIQTPMPHDGLWTWCHSHEDVQVFRFNAVDHDYMLRCIECEERPAICPRSDNPEEINTLCLACFAKLPESQEVSK